MSAAFSISKIGVARAAISLWPSLIRGTVPRRALGAYCIYRGRVPVYVGRSDRCVRARLLAHAAAGRGTHFAWEVAPNAAAAFILECIWYHQLTARGVAMNIVHPARRVAHSRWGCPICDGDHRDALERAIRSCELS